MTLIALSITSCSTDEQTGNKPETTSVSLNVETTSKTSKNVNRGSIYAWVKSISVTAQSTVWNYSKSETFDLVQSGGENSFKIDDVAVGNNNFTASTITDSQQLYQVSSLTPQVNTTSLATATSAITTMKNINPYAVYNGTKNGANILNNTINNVSIDMTTQNGRIITAFILDDDAELRANTYAIVTITTDAGTSTLTTAQIKNNVATFEWSNDKSTSGKTVTYTVKLYDDTAPNKVLKEYTITRAIIASTSYSCIYIIDRDRVINSKEDTLNFVFQKWEDVDCADVYDDGGYNCHGYNNDGKDKNGQNAFDDCGYHKIVKWLYQKKFDKTPNDNGSVKCN